MEPASSSLLAKVALGAATLMPPAEIPKQKPVELHVYLMNWENNSKSIINAQSEALFNKESFPLNLGKTSIDRKVEFEKVGPFIGNLMSTQLSLVPKTVKDNEKEELQLHFRRYFDDVDTNFIDITLRWHYHTSSVTASCILFDQSYRWNPQDSPLKAIHLLINGTLAGKDGCSLNESELTVQEIREDHVPSLLELAMRVVNQLIEDRKIPQNAIPRDTQDMLEKVRLIKRLVDANQPPIVLHF